MMLGEGVRVDGECGGVEEVERDVEERLDDRDDCSEDDDFMDDQDDYHQ
jgi:hypothetical protein